MSSTVAAGAVLLLAVLAPFEMTRPLLRLPGQSLSNVEAALLVACVAWAATVAWSAQWHLRRIPLATVWVAFVLVMAVAALGASAQRANATHMVGRLAAAGAVYLLAVQGLTTSERLRAAIVACVGSGAVVALLAILEYLQINAVLDLLRLFRPSVTAVGSQVRAGGSLQYPTIASMYLEVVFALGIGLMLSALDRGRPRAAWGWCLVLTVVGEAITLTFTRAGLITMATSLGFAGVWRWRQRRYERGTAMLGALAVSIVCLFLISRPAQSLWLRMTSEGQDSWYRADIEGPAQLSIGTNTAQYVPVRITNTGRVPWDSTVDPPIVFAYHWLESTGDRVVAWEGSRTPFSHTIGPGETTTVHALVRGPREPGRYRIEWDLAQEGRLWFSTEQGAPDPMTSSAIVTGTGTGAPVATSARPKRSVRPGRMVLWRTALRMVAAHPLLGVGPDNFRLLYGGYAGLPGADQRTHANNMYLEVLVGGGIVAFAVFALFAVRAYEVVATAICLGSDPRQPVALVWGQTRDNCRPLGLGIAAAGLAIALHALVDSFLSFAPTYILFALTLGFAAAVARGVETSADAHRV
jgi:O-antigen ligase